MFTNEDVLQSELTSLKNKIKVFSEILKDKQVEFSSDEYSLEEYYVVLNISEQFKNHFDL